MNDMTGVEIEKTFGFPGEVEFEGVVYVADRVGVPQLGDVYWVTCASAPIRDIGVSKYTKLILKPKPKQLSLADVPIGAVAVIDGLETIVIAKSPIVVFWNNDWKPKGVIIDRWYWPGPKEGGK